MKKRIRSAMVNLHIGGAVSVFVICVSLLACDHWLNRGETNSIQLSKAEPNRPETTSEFVSIPPRLFFFTQEPVSDRRNAGWYPRQWAQEAGSLTDNFQPENLAPDGNFFSSGVQNN